jgi:hypothetical protein
VHFQQRGTRPNGAQQQQQCDAKPSWMMIEGTQDVVKLLKLKNQLAAGLLAADA